MRVWPAEQKLPQPSTTILPQAPADEQCCEPWLRFLSGASCPRRNARSSMAAVWAGDSSVQIQKHTSSHTVTALQAVSSALL
jgi:hypothetical protein